jgi:hypothetical protein
MKNWQKKIYLAAKLSKQIFQTQFDPWFTGARWDKKKTLAEGILLNSLK